MKTPPQPRGRARRRGKADEREAASMQALAAAMEQRLGGKGKRGVAPASGGPSTAAAADRLAANRRRATRVRTGDS